MKSSYQFLSLVLDSITEHIVVIDEMGEIQFVNKSWSAFGNNNAGVTSDDWSGVNYLNECDKASAMGDKFATQAGTGIRNVIKNREKIFYFEYPCHSPAEKRWFIMRVTPFQISAQSYFVISHQNITQRKLAEQEVQNQARLDGLTNIANRRAFDTFVHDEWRRCYRLKKPICLAIVDIDYFKLLNDDYGHQAGDNCLVKVAELLEGFANRPGDIFARYGGDEFVLVWGDTSLEQAKLLSQGLLKKIFGLSIQNKNSPINSYLTASIGLAEMIPTHENEAQKLIAKADKMLYIAKDKGRDRVVSK